MFDGIVFDRGVHLSGVDDLKVNAFVLADGDQCRATYEGTEFQIGDGGNEVASLLHFTSVELSIDHGGGQGFEIDLRTDHGHVFFRSEGVLVYLLGFGIIAQAVLVDQIGAEEVLVAVDDDVEVVLHSMSH